jgi:hypothetical protein
MSILTIVLEACSKTRLPAIEQPNLSAAVTAEEGKVYLDSLLFQQIDIQLLNIKKVYNRICNWLLEQLEYKQ